MSIIRLNTEMTNKSKLGRLISKHNLSQKDLANYVNVTPASVNRWCNIADDGTATQFEYKLIPDIISFFKSYSISIHPNDILDLEQYGVEKTKLKIKGIIQPILDISSELTDIIIQPIDLYQNDDKYYEPNWNMMGEHYLIEERKNTNHLWYYIVDDGVKYKSDDNSIIDLPGIVYFKAYDRPVYISKIGREGNAIVNNLTLNLLNKTKIEMEKIEYVQLVQGVMYSK